MHKTDDEAGMKKTEGNISVPVKVKSFVIIAFTSVISYKIIITPFDFVFDFPSLLSLLLAFFSVGLAALFYFKATDTSNVFYDNTYKFTQQIAELLVRIESGFGEKLSHLDEGYKSMRDHFDKLPGKVTIEETQKELQKEENELDQQIKERDNLIEELAKKAKLREEEKNNFIEELNKKEDMLQTSRREISILRKNILRAKNERNHAVHSDVIYKMEPAIIDYLEEKVVSRIGGEKILQMSSSLISRMFREIKEDLPNRFIVELERFGVVDEGFNLTPHGIRLLKDISATITDRISTGHPTRG